MTTDYENYKKALCHLSSPSLFLDQEAFEKNLNWVISNAGSKKIRVATKSIRSPAILKMILDSNPVFQGLMSYTLQESLWLRSLGFKDILMGYPTTDEFALKKLAESPEEIILMVDRSEHLDLLEKIAKPLNATFSVCVDLDLSLDLPGVRFGVYRSDLHEEKSLKKFLQHLSHCPHIKLVGAMGYEAQIAGVMDEKAPLMKVLKSVSKTQLKIRREKMVDTILNHGHMLSFVNGGGTGSLKHTINEKCVTEVTIGSAFYAPVQFDHYVDFKLNPALFFTSPIVRKPADDIYTILGGGHVASGQTSDIKQPMPYLPNGLKLIKNEGAGEVQTPLKYSGAEKLNIGDIIIMRHAKAGEICEHFNEIHLLRKDTLTQSVTTYRGEGKSFL